MASGFGGLNLVKTARNFVHLRQIPIKYLRLGPLITHDKASCHG
jgi:hypothetical protein